MDDTTRPLNPHPSWSDEEPASELSPPSEPAVRTGPAVGSILLGTLCLIVATLALIYQVGDVDVDWSMTFPAVVVGAGALIAFAGMLGLARGRSSE